MPPDQSPSDLPPNEDEIYDEEEDEAFRLEDVSSDVEVDAGEADDDEECVPNFVPALLLTDTT